MATPIYDPSLTTHLQTCLLHGSEIPVLCSGRWKRKVGICDNKIMRLVEPGIMPLCRTHQDQRKQSTWCRAPLSCGSECGRICLWRPHRLQLCSEHQEYKGTCYFLKIPLETRLRIYSFLLPDKPIPARFTSFGCLTSDDERVSTKFLRVNRQIHDEGTLQLYAVRAFTILLAGNHFVMCNSTVVDGPSGSGGNHALQDYQMQLMLLEQQNKRRLLLARQEQDTINNQPPTSNHPLAPLRVREALARPFTFSIESEPDEPAWSPPLHRPYFDMIQTFRIDISFPSPGRHDLNHQPPRSPEAEAEALETNLYDYCDQLHQLVGRFRVMPQPITRLEIVLKFCKIGMTQDEIIYLVPILLRPFRRLRKVGQLAFPSIFVNDAEKGEIDLLHESNNTLLVAGQELRNYLNNLTQDLLSSELPDESSVFMAYWQLERILSCMKKCNYSTKFSPLNRLLHTARVAREADDLPGFKDVWNTVLRVWSDFIEEQKQNQENVELGIGAMESILHRDFSTRH